MKTLLIPLFFLCLFLAQPLFAQQLTDDEKAQYTKDCTTNPEVVGGFAELGKVLQYPKEAVEGGVSGTVVVIAYISADGEVDDTEVYKSDNQLLDSAALNAVKLVKFTPGKIDGAAVQCRVLVPIKFRLQ